MIVHYKIGCAGLHVRSDEIFGGVIHEIMRKAAISHTAAESGDFHFVGAVGRYHIVRIDLGMHRAKIFIKAVAVVTRVVSALGNKPEISVFF